MFSVSSVFLISLTDMANKLLSLSLSLSLMVDAEP